MSKRVIIALLLSCTMLLSASTTTFADSATNADGYTNPYEFTSQPDGIYTFLYHGYAPYKKLDIDTTNCIEDRLYVYNAILETVVQISDAHVTAYTTTKDALFYVTEAQILFRVDYSGNATAELYQAETGTIDDLDCYWDLLYFIEGGSKITLLNTSNGNCTTLEQSDELDWIFMLNKTTLLIATVEDEYYTYDYVSHETQPVLDDNEATCLVNQAVLNASNTNSGASSRTVYSGAMDTQENDISFPLDDYDAVLYDNASVTNFTHYRPISWFHYNGEEGCDINSSEDNCIEYGGTHECEGFGRYAHDRYVHLSEVTDYATWKSSKHPINTDFDLDGNDEIVKDFFEDLNTGAYVRYGRDGDTIAPEGVHSIVFVSRDSMGVWVYECNQSYYNRLTTEQKGGHPESYFGCGVHLQYYTYERIAQKYHFIAHYINHAFTDDPVYYNTTYHNVGCGSCNGFVRQAHTAASTYKFDGTYHWNPCSGCGGAMLKAQHIKILDTNGSYKCRICGCKVFDNSFQSVLVNDEA